ncbi:MAG: glycosyltransferase, partial [Magnetococcales bacterium]|nr:glycosyltransferase [Magnetococcales bacterium]
MKLAILIPAFNESGMIQKTIAQLLALTPRLQEMGVELQVFVVDDGSTDNTRQLA